MQSRILYTTSFGGSVCHPSCIHWSDDNKLVICIEKGIHILSTNHIPFESEYPLTFHQQSISAPEETLNFDVKVNNELLQSKLPTDDVHSMMLDHTLSPQTANAHLFLSFRSARWSPIDIIDSGRCILAVLTMDHRLLLYREIGSKWGPLIDLSTKFYNQHKEIWEKNKQEDTTESRDTTFMFQQMKQRKYKLAAIAMTWTQKFGLDSLSDGGMFCFLIAAMKSSHIIFWKVGGIEMIEVVAEWDSKLGYISSLCWQQIHCNSGFLILGSNSGRIVLLTVSITAEGGEIKFGENKTIWNDEDLIIVSQIVVMKQSENRYIVLATKDIYILSCEILVQDFNVVIRKIGYTEGLYSLSATGLCRVGNNTPHSQLALTSLDGRTVQLSIRFVDQRIVVDQKEINVDVEIDKLAPQGICCSQNGIFYGILYNIPVLYDPYITKEPLKLIIITTSSLEDVTNKLIKYTDTISTIGGTPSVIYTQFAQLSDYVDSFYAHLALGFAIPTKLEDLLTFQRNLDKQRLIRLQLIRQVLKVSLVVLTSDEKGDEIKAKLDTVESLIMRHHIVTIIGKFQRKLKEINDKQQRSLLLMNDWLLKKYHMVVNGIYSGLGENVPSSTDTIPSRELCRICKEPIPLDKIQYGVCPNSHKFGRCCKSLLLCDITSYRKCKCCKILNLNPPIWSIDPFCTFCNFILQ